MSIEGERLSDRMLREAIPFEDAIHIARRIAGQLADFHRIGVTHGALTPPKITLDNERHPSIELDSATLETLRERAAAGLPESAAPADAKASDVYALGCILFQMLSGQPPDGLLPLDALRPQLPAELHALVDAMLATAPTARPSMYDVAIKLAEFVPEAESVDPLRLRADLDRYKESLQWREAVVTTKQLAEIENDAIRRGDLYFSAAQICKDELFQPDDTIEYCNSALDSYFTGSLPDANVSMALKPFDMIERCLTEACDYASLERQYRLMISRVKSDARFHTLQAEMFDKLGEVYRSQLGDADTANNAFEQARILRSLN